MLKQSLSWNRVIAPLLVLSLTAAACSRQQSQRPGIDPAPGALAPADAAESFGLNENNSSSQEPLSPHDRYFLSMKKSALGKEFLLHASIIPQNQAPTSSGLQGRVVSFQRVLNSVFMIEGAQGHVVTHELPSTLILAEIPILDENDDALVLDFNQGMSSTLIGENWYGADIGSSYSASQPIAKALKSFIQSAELRSDVVEIRQIAQIDLSDAKGSSAQTFEFRYYISPYRPNPDFIPRETSNFQNVGFFETAPKIEPVSGRTIRHISRWDHSKPITYHVSANTPPEYVQAIRDGILYWNKAFGKEVVRAEVAPKGVTAPDPRYNIVQWVENDSAGSAYADGLMDPRTGEILHAQVYLTSVFAVQNRSRFPGILRRLKEQHNHEGTAGVNFLKSARLCDRELSEEFVQTFEKLIAEGANDEAFLQATRDYLSEVTAHEIGHTLGLRHNFAGSLASTIGDAERDQMLLNYLQKREIPKKDVVLTTSVMDYNVLADSILATAMDRESTHALSYDQMAISWAYEGKEIDPATAPLFCTDSHADRYRDCIRFDTGASPIASHLEKTQMNLRQQPIALVEKFIRAKTAPDLRDRSRFDRMKLDVKDLATPFVTSLTEISAWFRTSGVPSIRFERMFPYASDFNQDDILASQRKWVKDELARLGGAGTLLFSLLPNLERQTSLASEMTQNLNAYLSRENVRSGTGYDGIPYSLSSDEIEFIRTTGEKIFAKAEEQVIEKSLEVLASAKFAMELGGEAIEQRLGSTAIAILLAQGSKVVPGIPANSPAPAVKSSRLMQWLTTEASAPEQPSMREFKYSRTVRIKAAKLLARSLGEPNDWSALSRAYAMNGLKNLVTATLGTELDKVDPSKLSRAQRQWVMEQMDLLKLIAQLENM
ncbi:MAG: hypothetical protein A2X94_17645 [Bdellovibrionales bacterium GWB1_55_8]|nr:MAG: hypothetical protein A2X94_17645 [Bdellovibrionales bacterium GWB1_55_8]